ncbi:dihydrofolate reductase family protein [Nocardia camponoti]|uniref:Deaminase n=1 Tax=Nocardia camponoti TaxID=1616106 RepID=A0A917Q940_9NOCA|nr:dihydrofolate reductase family protein [Nocardia camponoti]GGK36158.1 deaminase [Nocardia camponoti]
MRTLVYGFSVSVDGFINDQVGSIDWTEPDDELHQFHNDRYREIEVSLHGRRLYELMADYWPTVPDDAPPIMREFGELWTAKPKVVFSRTLPEVGWNSRLVRDNAVDEVRKLKEEGDGIIEIGGADLAASILPSGLVDEFQLFTAPIILGGGTPMFPPLGERIPLRLIETRHFKTVVMTRYAVER